MRIAVTARTADPDSEIDPRFGRAAHFAIFDTDTEEYACVPNAQNMQAAQGAGIQAGQTVAAQNVDWVVSGNFGPKAFAVLRAAGIKAVTLSGGTVAEAVASVRAGKLEPLDGANVEGHWQ